MTIVVGIEELLEPLKELKVVLETSLDKPINRYFLLKIKVNEDVRVMALIRTYLVTSNPFEGSLEDLEVLDVFVFQVRPPLNFLELSGSREEKIHELAVCSPYIDIRNK